MVLVDPCGVCGVERPVWLGSPHFCRENAAADSHEVWLRRFFGYLQAADDDD